MEDEDLDALLDNLSDDDDDYDSAPGGFLGAIDEEEDLPTDRFADIDTSLVYDVNESKIIDAGGVVAATRSIGTTDQATQLANIRVCSSLNNLGQLLYYCRGSGYIFVYIACV